MRARLAGWRFGLGESLWFIPAVCTAAAVALALGLVRLDQELTLDRRTDTVWLFGGGAEGARGVLAAIAGTMVAVTATVFSVTIVALQLASSQFSPRILRRFTGDRGNQVVLGAFIGTFTYALLVLRAVRSAAEDGTPFVPVVAVTVAIVLALVAVGLLIYYIHHAARSIQAAVVVDRAAADTLALVDDLFPEHDEAPPDRPDPPVPPGEPGLVRGDGGGYLQAVAVDPLRRTAQGCGATVRVVPLVGDFVLPGDALAEVWPADALGREDDPAGPIRAAFLFGPERTLQEDVEFGIRQLADIAVKALSPGINDPTTAVTCVDRLTEVLLLLGRRARPWQVHGGGDGAGRVLLRNPSFARSVDVAFAQVRLYGAGDPVVAAHLAASLGRLADRLPPGCRAPLAREARLVLEAARERLTVSGDLERVETAAAWVLPPAPADRASLPASGRMT